jgi:hypothetical protein
LQGWGFRLHELAECGEAKNPTLAKGARMGHPNSAMHSDHEFSHRLFSLSGLDFCAPFI